MKTIRIKDVAEHANVSVATITRVINNSGYVSDITRARVMESIDTLGYIPNRMASALKSNSSRIIGNIIPTSDVNSFFTNVSNAIDSYSKKQGYRIFTMTTNLEDESEDTIINEMLGHMVDGIILTCGASSFPKNIQTILDKNIPVIMIERPTDIYGVDKILINDLEGSALAADKLLQNGHKNICIIGVDKPEMVEMHRIEGFISRLASADITLPTRNIVFAEEYWVEFGYNAMKQIIETSPPDQRPTACFITSDVLACGALQYLYQHGMRVPEDMSIIGYDNTLSSLCSPAISSIAFPIDEIGKTAVDMFLERKNQERTFAKSVTLSPFFMDRNSVRNLK